MGDGMQNEYENIHLKHLILSLAKRWHVFVISVLVGIIVFGLYGTMELRNKDQKMAAKNYISTQKVKISEAEFADVKIVAEYDDLIKEQENYCSDSILMNIDPNKKYSRTDCFYISDIVDGDVDTIINEYRKKVEAPEFYKQISASLEEEILESYYREIIMFESVPNSNMFRISVNHYDAEKNEQLTNIIANYIHNIKAEVLAETFSHQLTEEKGMVCETVDLELVNVQLQALQALRETRDIRNGKYIYLSDNQKEYLELYHEARYTDGYEEGQALEKEVSVKTSKYKVSLKNLKGYLKKGVLYSILVCLVILTCMYIYSPVLLNPADIEENYHLPLLGQTKQKKGESQIVAEEKWHYLLEQQEYRDSHVLFVFCNEQIKENMWNEQFIKSIAGESRQIKNVIGNLDEQENLKVLNWADALIFVEKTGKTSKKQLRTNISTCELLNKKIIGVIL